MGKGLILAIILASLLIVSCAKKASDSKYACQCYYEDNKGVTQYPIYTYVAPSRDLAKKECSTQDSLTKSWYGHTSSACYLN